MKSLLIIPFLFFGLSAQSNGQTNIVHLKDIPDYLNKEITIQTQVIDFDSRGDYWYLYIGDHYPNQRFTILVKKVNGTKRMKFNMDILLGRKIAYFTGTVNRYAGNPDSSANPEIEKIRQEIEQPRPITIGETSGMGYFHYMPKTAPIDLRGKLVMMITDKKQIGKKLYPALVSLY